MKKHIRDVIRKAKLNLLKLDVDGKYTRFATCCLLEAADAEGSSFELKIICGAFNTSDNDYATLYEESKPITIESFYQLVKDCHETYPEQSEIIIANGFLLVWGFIGLFGDDDYTATLYDFKHFLETMKEEKDFSWITQEDDLSGCGIRIFDYTM